MRAAERDSGDGESPRGAHAARLERRGRAGIKEEVFRSLLVQSIEFYDKNQVRARCIASHHSLFLSRSLSSCSLTLSLSRRWAR